MPTSPSETRSQLERLPHLSRLAAPRVFRYVVTHDSGFAPCFEGGICTLACCKPNIRLSAIVGDWVLGFAPQRTGEARLLYAMRVGEVLDFGSYATDHRFAGRRDNIYYSDGSCGIRRVATHATHLEPREQARDLRGRNVLIADWWRHFEPRGLDLRIAVGREIARRLWYAGRGHKVNGLLPGDLQALRDALAQRRHKSLQNSDNPTEWTRLA
jgi:putative DNA base modification enzyme with NMAD domain